MSSESCDVPDAWPWTAEDLKIIATPGTCIGSSARADDDELSARLEAAKRGRHRIGDGDGREDHLRAAELVQLLGDVGGFGVDVVVRAKLFRQRLLVFAACDGDDLEAHLGRELDAEMAESADPENGDEVARPRDGLAQGVERRDARTQQRGGVDIGQVVGMRASASAGATMYSA